MWLLEGNRWGCPRVCCRCLSLFVRKPLSMESMLTSSFSNLSALSVPTELGAVGEPLEKASSSEPKASDANDMEGPTSREEVFHHLVERCWQKGYWIAYDILGRADEAEDLCQDALVRAYENWDSFRNEASIDTWFYRIVTNLSLNQKRRRGIWSRVREFVMRDKEQDREEWCLPTSLHPEKQLQARELGESIQHAMKHLSPKQHTVFVLRYLQGFSVREIADFTDVSEGTVKTHIFRALQTMRDQLEHVHFED